MHRSEDRMREEELVTKADAALKDPWMLGVVWRALATERSVVTSVERVSKALELERIDAARLRYAAILARDYPERFRQFIHQIERDQLMTNINAGQQNVMTPEHLYDEKRYPFFWGDWPCQMVVPKKQSLFVNNLVRDRASIDTKAGRDFIGCSTGFCARVEFLPHSIDELKARLVQMGSVGGEFEVFGMPVFASIQFEDPDSRFDRPGYHLQDYWRCVRMLKTDVLPHPLAAELVRDLSFAISVSGESFLGSKEDLPYNEEYRERLMITCIGRFFGIVQHASV